MGRQVDRRETESSVLWLLDGSMYSKGIYGELQICVCEKPQMEAHGFAIV